MKIIHSILLTTLLLALCSFAFAKSTDNRKPRRCPTIIALKAGGIGTNPIFFNGNWFAGRRHMNYGTRRMWTFLMGPISASDSSDAYSKAVTGLRTLTFLFGPNLGSLHTWECVYNTIEGYPAVATTPAIAP